MGKIYEDKLEGKISEEFWERKQFEYCAQERETEAQLSALRKSVSRDGIQRVEQIFKLANKAHFL